MNVYFDSVLSDLVVSMRILEQVQAFLPLLTIEIFLFFLLTKRKTQKNLKIQMR